MFTKKPQGIITEPHRLKPKMIKKKKKVIAKVLGEMSFV